MRLEHYPDIEIDQLALYDVSFIASLVFQRSPSLLGVV